MLGRVGLVVKECAAEAAEPLHGGTTNFPAAFEYATVPSLTYTACSKRSCARAHAWHQRMVHGFSESFPQAQQVTGMGELYSDASPESRRLEWRAAKHSIPITSQ